jgi:hypothetical protein
MLFLIFCCYFRLPGSVASRDHAQGEPFVRRARIRQLLACVPQIAPLAAPGKQL